MKLNFTKGLYNWTVLGLLAAVLVLLNFIGSMLYFKLDMTKDQRYSLANSTVNYLSDKKNFENRISIQIYLDGNMPSELKNFQNALKDKLKDFKRIAGTRIEFLFTDPNVGTEDEINALRAQLYDRGKGILPLEINYLKDGTQSQMLLFPGALLSYSVNGITKEGVVQFLPGTQPGRPYALEQMSEMIENALNNLEYNLLSAMRRLTQTSKPTIAFLQGHGELNPAETMRARALISPYYQIKDVALNDSIAALKDVDGLIIADPQTPFSQKDLYLIDQFVLRGGKLLCFMNTLALNEDTLNATGMTHTTRKNLLLDRLLFDYGIKIKENYVLDANCAPKIVPFAETAFLPWFYHMLATPSLHPMTRNVDPISLKYANEIEFVQVPKAQLTPILTSSSNAIPSGLQPLVNLALPLNYGKNPKLVDNPEDEINKLCVAGLSEGFYQSHFKNRIVAEFANSKDANYLEESQKETKILVVGNGSFIRNSYDSILDPQKINSYLYRPIAINELKVDAELAQRRIPIIFGNQELFQNMVDYMMGDNSVLDIRSRQIDIKEIDKEKIKSSSLFYKSMNMMLPLLLILALAFIMNWIRQRRYTR
ncbi:MAG: Gldg family protein [Crocinitomicaceae bacterium]|jgi:gliding-associated putative ABC transporter substrate-binding component GldG|nr:Gldg family protein [Crocinitomicaceae bacterium]MDP4724443.1 Gldg family protein [Crocinitomicaceae bacterium]MDP4738650.1 Gldg family protein [Crocinitomicaceae bacterium]MDP4800061.1 Gldg family protein [Crocinitomicaceae bacterium]MDP4806477.1 Gldg family protein [Crocinitomicaceae bacterium]